MDDRKGSLTHYTKLRPNRVSTLPRVSIQANSRRVFRSLRHYNFTLWLHEEIGRRRISLRFVARQLGYPNASRITEYLQGRRVPTAEMIRRIAEAIGLSPIEALSRAGHDSTLLLDLVELYRLGWEWCRQDRVHFDPRRGVLFSAIRAPDVTLLLFQMS